MQFDHRPKKQLLWAVVFCMCGTHERSLTLPNKQVQGPLQGKKCQFCVYRTVHGSTAPPNKINILWPKCATAPLKINILPFCTATAPPPVGTSRWVQTGLGLGLGVQGQGQVELVGGKVRCGNSWPLIGRLPDHSSLTLLKHFNFHHRPATAPFRSKFRLSHRPVTAPTKKNN